MVALNSSLFTFCITLCSGVTVNNQSNRSHNLSFQSLLIGDGCE